MPEAADQPAPEGEVTELLHRWAGGDAVALERLTPLVYAELHRMAGRFMARLDPVRSQPRFQAILRRVGLAGPASGG